MKKKANEIQQGSYTEAYRMLNEKVQSAGTTSFGEGIYWALQKVNDACQLVDGFLDPKEGASLMFSNAQMAIDVADALKASDNLENSENREIVQGTLIAMYLMAKALNNELNRINQESELKA